MKKRSEFIGNHLDKLLIMSLSMLPTTLYTPPVKFIFTGLSSGQVHLPLCFWAGSGTRSYSYLTKRLLMWNFFTEQYLLHGFLILSLFGNIYLEDLEKLIGRSGFRALII